MTDQTTQDNNNTITADAKPATTWQDKMSVPLTLTLTTLRPPVALTDIKVGDFDFKKPSLTTRFTEEEVCKAIENNKGVKWLVCKELECSLFQLKKYLQTHPNANDFMQACQDGLVEFATAVLHDNLSSTDEALREKAAEFILKQYNDNSRPPVQITVMSEEAKKIQIASIFGIQNN